MLRKRVIPALLLRNESLVKTLRFGKFTYVGDPCNTVRIFNELEVDELLFLDIAATREKRSPNLKVLTDIANECFKPLSYGGGGGSRTPYPESISIQATICLAQVLLDSLCLLGMHLLSA